MQAGAIYFSHIWDVLGQNGRRQTLEPESGM